MLRLPLSGLPIMVRQPTGAEDILLHESGVADIAAAVELLGRVVLQANGSRVDWREMGVSDVEAALLFLRQATVGDRVSTSIRCPAPDCGQMVDIGFRIGDFLASRKSRKPRGVTPSSDGEWFAVAGGPLEFRLPKGGDLLASEGEDDPYRALLRRCVRPSGLERAAQRAESAMEALAPRFSAMLGGECPECGRAFQSYFDPISFVIAELRGRAASVYQEVHLLALHYRWHEAEILALPKSRRMAYAEMLSGGWND